jgi:hypothetical protein
VEGEVGLSLNALAQLKATRPPIASAMLGQALIKAITLAGRRSFQGPYRKQWQRVTFVHSSLAHFTDLRGSEQKTYTSRVTAEIVFTFGSALAGARAFQGEPSASALLRGSSVRERESKERRRKATRKAL